MFILLANGTANAGESIGQVFVWFLMVVGTLALIYAVLTFLDRRYKKNGGEDPAPAKKKDPKTFGEVLSEKIEQKKEKDEDTRV
ncbi:MAG: hypothetical protein IJT87_00765 [Ruminiclostridium sp.]|nr:hypothetical protein [Ruminiclostridium sp.]